MGMDVYGKSPDSKVGEYFRNNIWGWHPLWDYCCRVSTTAANVEDGHANSGGGLGKQDSLDLAKVLRSNIASGATARHEAAFEADLIAFPDKDVEFARNLAEIVGAEACPGFAFHVEDVANFAEFLEHCGGFEIW